MTWRRRCRGASCDMPPTPPGIFFMPHSHLDMVRPGLALYGVDPGCRAGAGAAVSAGDAVGGAAGVGSAGSEGNGRRLRAELVGSAIDPDRSGAGRLCRRISTSVSAMRRRAGPWPARRGRRAGEHGHADDRPWGHHRLSSATRSRCSTTIRFRPPASISLPNGSQTIPYEIFCRIGARIPRIAIDSHASEDRSRASRARG